MKYNEIVMGILLIVLPMYALMFFLGYCQGRISKIEPAPVSICTQSKGDVYNVIMLRNCLQKLSVK